MVIAHSNLAQKSAAAASRQTEFTQEKNTELCDYSGGGGCRRLVEKNVSYTQKM